MNLISNLLRKRRTKLRKFLLRSLLFLLLFSGLSAVLLRSRSVQTYLAKRAGTSLGKELGCTVTVGSVEFDLFQNLRLQNVYISDQQGDTLIFAGVVSAKLKKINLNKRVLDLFNVELHDVFVHIGRYKDIPGNNIDFLVDYLNGPPKKKTKNTKVPWFIKSGQVKLVNSRFHVFDYRKTRPKPGVIDDYYLEFNNINGVCSDFRMLEDSMHFRAKNWNLTERSGLAIQAFNAYCNIHNKGMDFDKLDLKMPCSHLKGDLHFKYPGFKYLDEFIHNTQWKGNLKNSSVCLSELSIFDQSLKGNTETIQVTTGIAGTFDNLKLNKLNAVLGSDTRLKGDLLFEGLPDWRTTFCDFELDEASTNAVELSKLLQGQELPEVFNRLGALNYSGRFTGQFLDFKLQGLIQTDLGNITTEALMNFKEGYNNASYSGKFVSDGFQAGEMLGISGILDQTAFSMEIDGAGFTPGTFGMKVNADFPTFEFRNRRYEKAEIDGEVTMNNFTGTAMFDDPRLNTEFGGKIDFSEASPVFEFTTLFKGLDLYEMGLDSTRTLVYGKTKVNFRGVDPINAEGSLDINNLAIHRGGKVYQYGSQNITKTNDQLGSGIVCKGDIVNGKISGNFDLFSLPTVFKNAVSRVFPERIKSVPYQGRDSFVFAFNIPETGLFASFIAPNLTTTGFSVQGFVNAAKGSLSLQTGPLDACFGDFQIEQIGFSSRLTDSSDLDFTLSAGNISYQDSAWFNNLALMGTACHSRADFEFKINDARWGETIDIIANSTIGKDSIRMNLDRSSMNLFHHEWQASKNSSISINQDGSIKFSELNFNGEDSYFEVNGFLSASKNDTLKLDFGNFHFENLKPFIPDHSLDSLDGVFNGTVYASSIFSSPRIWGDIAGRKLKFAGFNYGDIDVALNENGTDGRLSLKSRFIHGPLKDLSANGSIAYEAKPGIDPIDIRFSLPQGTSVKAVQPFLQGILTFNQGTLQADVHLGGSFSKPELKGFANLKDARFMVDYLKTQYSGSLNLNIDNTGFYTKKPAKITDETGKNHALASLSITHQNYSDWYLDVRIDSAKNLKCLNTNASDDDLYYGTGYADGGCRIYGPFDRISMDIKLKTRKNTQIFLMYSDVEENEVGGFVKFRDHFGKPTGKEKRQKSGSIYRINIELQATPDAEAQFVIDKRLGDIIRGRGEGTLRMLYDENGQFFLYGNYAVNEGDYVFSLPGINVLTRKIALNKGGTISWDGDPFNAILNMTGSFEKKISPSALMYAVNSGGNKSYPATRIVSQLIMKGNLFSPEISFDLQAPDLQSGSGATGSEVYSVIQRIRTDKDETMRQAVALLLFGNFIPPSFSSNPSAGVISGSGVAGNSLSGIASSVVNDLFSRLGIPTRIQVNIDDVRSGNGSKTAVFINSEWFLTERLRLDLNYDPTVAMLVSNLALPLNFNLEYMTRSENWRIRAFSRSNNLLLQQNNSTITNGVSGNTLGGGLVYKREFNTFRASTSK